MANIVGVNFYQMIDNEFGNETREKFKAYANCNRKLSSMTSRKKFLIRCRRSGIIPSHIVNSFKCVFPLLEQNSPFIPKLQRCISKFQKSLLNIEIRQTYHSMNQLQKEQSTVRGSITSIVPSPIAESFFMSQQRFFENNVTSTTTVTKRKFDRLLTNAAQHCNPDTLTVNTKAIHNATAKTLPPETEVLLSLGPKFALPYTSLSEIPFGHIIADLENVIMSENDRQVRERIRCSTVNIVQNFIHRFADKQPDMLSRFLTHACNVTRKFTKSNTDIIIVESDKGKQTVVMYKEDYDTKMRAMLSDEKTYRAISRNPTWNHQQTNNNFVTRLRNLSLIDARTAYQLKTNTAQCPRIYGLPKVHKPNMPLRPVVSNIGAPSYMLSKYVGQILQASIKSTFNIRDSFSFCSYINSVCLPEDYILVSFDVTSLFTCIPTDMIPGIIINRWQDIKENTNINLDLFLEIVNFCLNGSYFSYKGKYYNQIFGTAMGNPLSPTVADLVMESLLGNVVSKIDFPVPVLKKYVDDLILALPPDRVVEVLDTFNNFNQNIQFTFELEQNRRIPFLDMVLVRLPDQTIRTEWYSKPMASGRLLDFHSSHPLHLKMNTIVNFIHRVRQFTTNGPKEAANNIIEEHLKRNHYPSSLRRRLLNGHTVRNKNNTTVNETTNTTEDAAQTDMVPAPTVYKPMLFVNDLTQRLMKSFKAALPNTVLATRCENTTRRVYTNMKDNIPTEMRFNVIYRIPCNDCPSSYVGLTTTQLKKRLSSHRSTINQLEMLRSTNIDSPSRIFDLERLKEKTALLQHSIDENHNFNLEKTKILDHHRRKSALPFLEVFHIVNTDHTVNKRSDVDHLSSMYAGILHTLKRRQPNHNNTHTNTNN